MPFTHVIEVRWSDCDANQHVRHSAYADFCAHARLEMLRSQGFPYERFQALGFGPVLFRETIDYFRELRMSERVTVEIRAAGLSADGGRFRLQHALIRGDGQLAARLEATGAWLDLATRRLRPPPDDLRATFDALERTADFEVIATRAGG